MNPLSTAAAMAASVTVYVGLYHFWLHLRRTNRSDFYFALTCLCMTAYDASAAFLYNAPTPGEGAIWQRMQFVSVLCMGMPFLLLVNEQVEIRTTSKWMWALGLYPVLAVVTFVDPAGLLITDVAAPKVIGTPWGQQTIQELQLGPLSKVFEATVPFMLFYCAWVGLGAARFKGGKVILREQRSSALVLAAAALMLAMMHDMFVSRGLLSTPYTMEFGWLGVMLVMSWTLSNEVFEASRTRDTLAETERREATTLSAIQDAVVTTDMNGNITHLNPAAEKLLAIKLWDVVDQPLGRFVELTTETSGIVSDPVRFALGRPPNPYGALPQLVTTDGSERRVDLGGVPIKDPEGHVRGAIVVMRDLTLQHNALDSLQHAKRMESMGQLAGGTAHDLNNLLTPIISYVELVQRSLGPTSKESKFLEHVQDAAQRAAGLTKQLLALSRKQVLDVKVLPLTEFVRQTIPIIERLVGEEVELEVQLDDDAGKVRVDPGQFEQVLLNLATNARDALDGSGRLTIATRRLNDSESSLEVIDTGVGMDAPTAKRIFEPFFTTKARGKGTGLGLASVRGIVEQHGGSIYVDSELGEGTSFEIVLPTSAGEQATSSSADSTPGKLVRGTEQILVVEDDSAVRSLVFDALTELGYKVHLADGLAMSVAIAQSEPIEALLTDVILPGADGPRIRDAVHEHRNVPCLFMTGHADDRLGEQGIVPRGTEVLRKPFTVEELGKRLRQVLDTGRGKTIPPGAED